MIRLITYLVKYVIKCIVLILLALGLEKAKVDVKKQQVVLILLNVVLFFALKFNIFQVISYFLCSNLLNFCLFLKDQPKYKQKNAETIGILVTAFAVALTIIDFDIIFITRDLIKLAYFTLTELLIISIFIINCVPKLLVIYGNVTQINVIAREEFTASERNGTPKNVKFYLFLIIKIVGDVFLTNRKELVRNREVKQIQQNVNEILTILKAQEANSKVGKVIKQETQEEISGKEKTQ